MLFYSRLLFSHLISKAWNNCFQLDLMYEGYKRTEMKENPKAHLLMEWLKKNIPKDGKKAGMKRFILTLV